MIGAACPQEGSLSKSWAGTGQSRQDTPQGFLGDTGVGGLRDVCLHFQMVQHNGKVSVCQNVKNRPTLVGTIQLFILLFFKLS